MSWIVRVRRARLLALVVSLVAISAPMTSAASAADSYTAGGRPTVVLVHGAWADPTSWNGVVARLRHDGYRTATPKLDLQSIAGDVANVRGVLDSIPGRKVLVAHSYGGIVSSEAATGRSDVLALVYTAAFVPEAGDSIASLGTGFRGSEAFAHLAFTGAPFGSPAYIAPNFFRQFFAQDLSATQAGLLNAAQQPLNFPIVTTPSGPIAWHVLPSWYAVSGADLMIDPAQQRWMASRAGASTVEYDGASHAGGLTRFADQFAQLIERAVRATNR